MICPHCTIGFKPEWEETNIGYDSNYNWDCLHCRCSECEKSIIAIRGAGAYVGRVERIVHPKGHVRKSLPDEVDDVAVVNYYNESCLVLEDSPKASAALSRRSLQHILREKLNVKKSSLNAEIQEVIDSELLPSDLANNLDAIRNTGNFAAHPTKSTSTGEIVEVELGEAEWNLEVLEDLIEYTFVRPARSQAKRESLNAKLKDAGKPEMQ